jgi:hypothetical protein
MLEKSTLDKCFDFCTENPYNFLLITNQPDGRPRVMMNVVKNAPVNCTLFDLSVELWLVTPVYPD